MAPPDIDPSRSTRLSKYFDQVLAGKRAVKNIEDGKRFLEAICDQKNPSSSVEKLIASAEGLNSLQRSLRFDVQLPFLNGLGAEFVNYLADDDLKQLCNGQFLHQIVAAVVEPPTFWNALANAHKARTLSGNAVQAFAWLLLELLSSKTNGRDVPDVRAIAETVTQDKSLLDSPVLEVRTLGHKIKSALLITSVNASHIGNYRPGGRHDNDFEDFREVAILPTADEFASTEKPFYVRADAIEEKDPEQRGAAHLDNQFRLLREDFLGELRNDLQIASGQKKGRRTGSTLVGLSLEGIYCDPDRSRKPCCLKFKPRGDFWQLQKLPIPKRKVFIKENRNFMKHQSFGCLMSENQLLAFACVERDEDLLAQKPPVVVLNISGETAFIKTLIASKTSRDLRFVQVETAIFAYEPILKRLQEKSFLPLAEELFGSDLHQIQKDSEIKPARIIERIKEYGTQDLQWLLNTPKSIQLDSSQLDSLVMGLEKRLSLIQGPPGTGKSFIGALITKILHDYTSETILIICYTNHALDQFLEDLMDIGIKREAMVRLGSKSTARTESLNISKQSSTFKRSQASWDIINKSKLDAETKKATVSRLVDQYRNSPVSKKELLDYLEFADDEAHFYPALSVPEDDDGMIPVGRDGKKISHYYLLDRWEAGQDAGIFKAPISTDHSQVWKMNKQSRRECLDRWALEFLKERATNVYDQVRKFDECQEIQNNVWSEKNAAILKEKRIIGCTTTAAAMYAKELEAACPGIILVEEAGEILESHILTAMTPNTKQLVLIGDHKQLRPKVNNYGLTVEKGDGYNLNVSLFERLVLAGVPHTTLSAQHRMSPEISALVRHLTYPKLLDAPKTIDRPPIRGMQDRVVFFNHDHPELDATEIADRRDEGSKSSKENAFEVEMVLKCVKYLGQQGYGTDKLVILTPYLGQLRLLLNELRNENDPVLNDLDSYDLIRAGLLPAAAANIHKNRIRISTIDNYQGEESDIVISTLTRSNPRGDIGFMSSPQRLNVLLSRARNGLIMIGNAATFMESRRGKDVWLPLFDYLKSHGHIYGGLPVKCERHPTKSRILEKKEDFDIHCPDGGCDEPCGKKLSCGVHDCPQRCHQIVDHTKMKCQHPLQMVCSKNHKMRWLCYQKAPPTCRKCDAEALELKRKQKRDHQLEVDREAKQKAYERELAGIKDKIDFERRLRKDMQDDDERARVLAQYKKDLEDIKQEAAKSKQWLPSISAIVSNFQIPGLNIPQIADVTPANTGEKVRDDSTKPMDTKPMDTKPMDTEPIDTKPMDTKPMDIVSSAKDDWDHQKKFEGASNKELDTLMGMIGLENVKQQFLDIKVKIDTVIRQKTSMKDERFGAAFLGNPGTGKTTVARLYAGFLASVGALPGDCFVETSGSRLSNEGINGCKKHIEDILNNGGGALFIDEAYQLVSANNYGGTQVLDFLLAEIENLTGKMVVILAGYNKQMEAFFAHNPGLPSRIPYQLQFEDYDDSELLQILQSQIQKKYNGGMKVEDGYGGLYMRIVARRIGRGRGRDGFGNARAVHNVFAQITNRQAKRLQKERRASPPPDDMLLMKVDLLGQEPSEALMNSKAWKELQDLIGLKSLKESVKSLFDSIKANYDRELEELPLVEYSLNKVFLGSPGTGKTSVGKLYGQILADIGLLTSGEVVVKNPADFVGDALGRSESQTKGILAATVGKVLIIDEAYMLGAGAGGGGTSAGDPYKTAVIDTIVAEVQSTPGEDRCVLLLGYKEQMEEMFQNVNPGLSRRFPISSGFVFEDFTDPELRQILELKLKKQGFKATDQAKGVAMDVLRRARNKPNFGNAGEVDILLDKAKACHQKRLSSGKSKKRDILEPPDFDEDFDRGKRALTNIRMLFQDVIGCDAIVAKLEGYQNAAANLTAMGEDPKEQIPFSFLFRGPPGTGKTTTAKKMGKVFYDMGFLATAEVVECSASELVGQYVGQTGPKTQKLLERALGKVLFVDEAYRLAEGHFAKEAMDEIVACLTNPKFAQKLVVILAGYDEDINRLMSINPGLTSRFPEAIVFNHLSPDECIQLLETLFSRKSKLNSEILRTFPGNLRQNLTRYFEELINLPAWGNARDVHTLAKNIWGKLISTRTLSPTGLILTEDVINEAFSAMISERSHRAQSKPQPSDLSALFEDMPQLPTQHLKLKPPEIQTTVSTATTTAAASAPPPHPPVAADPALADAQRDAGVSDTIWAQLQEDKRAMEAKDREQEKVLQRYEELKAAQVADAALAAEPEIEQENPSEEDDYARRMHELARVEHVKAMLERQKELEELERRRKAVLEERKKEAKAQAKLREMGVCVAGYRWIKQASGYGCAGGSHFVSDAQLGLS